MTATNNQQAYRDRQALIARARHEKLVASGEKRCSKCAEIQPLTQFHKAKTRAGFATTASSCKRCVRAMNANWCRRNPDKIRAYQDRWREKNLQYFNTTRKAARYGITHEDVLRMLAEQHERCAICNVSFGKYAYHIDHCHKTGKVRALLCQPCNCGLGSFHDSIERVAAALSYLRQHGTTSDTTGA